MGLGEIQVSLEACPPCCLSSDKTALCWTASSPGQISTGSLVHNPAVLGQQPAPLRGSGSDSCPELRHLPCSLPRKQGPHPLDHHQLVHGRFGYERKHGETHTVLSPRRVPSPCSQLLSLCSGLWTNQGEVIRGKGELILHNLVTDSDHAKWHWAWHLEVSHACSTSEVTDPKLKCRN